MKKYYAVRKGRKTGIFDNWSICEQQIKGFSGAEYKSFKTLKDAQDYMQASQDNNVLLETTERHYPCAYVDGSYDAVTHRFSYGAVILLDTENEQHFSEMFDEPTLAKMRNVAGEIKGCEFAITYALKHQWESIDIYYDYYGIEKWALGEWKRNLPETQAYYEFCQRALSKIIIRFIKVKGHSGDSYNDLADALAKKALNL